LPLLIRNDCPDCREFMRTGDFFHSKEVWDKYHNSGWINGKSDWQPREEISDTLDKMKQMWLEVQRMKSGKVEEPMAGWKLQKILSKKKLPRCQRQCLVKGNF